MNASILARENTVFHASGGVSANNRSFGFRPAFRNNENGDVYASRFADGSLAPIHMIDGLPDEVVVRRSAAGRVTLVKASVQAGFVLDGIFYGREEAALRAEQAHARDFCSGAEQGKMRPASTCDLQ